MQFIPRLGPNGDVIGFDAVDDDGRAIDGGAFQRPGDRPAPQRDPLPGEPLPMFEGDFRSPGEKRAAAAEQRRAANEGSEESETDTDGYYVPSDVAGQVTGNGVDPSSGPGVGRGGYRERNRSQLTAEGQAVYARNQEMDEKLEEGREAGGLQAFGAGFLQGGRNVARGLIDAAEEVSDFGAAIVDTLTGREVNDDDNWFNTGYRITDPTSAGGQFLKEAVSFGVTAAATGGVIKAGAAASLPVFTQLAAMAHGGAKARIAYSAAVGFAGDFIKAKPAEQNIYNSLQGTPLENGVTNFFASTDDEDASLWMAKIKEGIGGIPLGIAFDGLGEGASSLMKRWKSEPVEAYLNGVRKAKAAPEAEQAEIIAKATTAANESEQTLRVEMTKLLQGGADERITDARRLLAASSLDDAKKAKLISFEIEQAPILARGQVDPNWDVTKLELLEEEAVRLEELRNTLYGLEAPDGVKSEALESLDNTLFDLDDQMNEIVTKVNTPAAPPPSITPEEASIQARVANELIEIAQGNEGSASLLELRDRMGQTPSSIQDDLIGKLQQEGAIKLNPSEDGEDYFAVLDETKMREVIETFTPASTKEAPTEVPTLSADDQRKVRFLEDEIKMGEDIIKDFQSQIEEVRRTDGDLIADASLKQIEKRQAAVDASKLELEKLRPETPAQPVETPLDVPDPTVEWNPVTPDGAPQSNVMTPGFQPTPGRDPQAPPSGAGRVDDVNAGLLEPTPGRAPQAPPSGAGQVDVLGDPTARGQQPRYRSKAEIKAEVARKTVEARVRPEGTKTPEVKPEPSTSNVDGVKPPEASTTDNMSPLKPKEGTVKARKAAVDLGIDTEKLGRNLGNQYGKKSSKAPTDKWLNVDKLTDNEDIRDAVIAVMETIENSDIIDSVSQATTMARANKLVAGALGMDDDDAVDALLKYYVGNTGNLPVSNVALRELSNAMGQQMLDSARRGSLGKAFDQLSLVEHTAREEFIHYLSRFEHFLTLNKNLGKLTAQGLNARNIQLTDEGVQRALASEEYAKIWESAVKTTDADARNFKTEMQRLLSDPKGRERFEKIMTDISIARTPEEIANAAKLAKFSISGSKLIQGLRMNNMLSGTRTQMANLLGNSLMTVYAPATQYAGGALNWAEHRMKGMKVEAAMDRQAMRESLAALSSLTSYMKDSARIATVAGRLGGGILEPDQIAKEIADQSVDLLNPQQGPEWFKWGIKAWSLPARGLVTGDEFFKQLNYRSNVHGRAVVNGYDRGLRGPKLKKFVEDIVEDSLALDEKSGIKGMGHDPASMEYARYVTFQSEINQGNSTFRRLPVELVRSLRQTPILGPISTLFVPFIQTPTNMMAYSGRNSPLALLSKSWKDDIAAGGARAARAKGEFAMGTSLLLGVTALGLDGKLQGAAPEDPDERALFYASGQQPYSFRLSDGKHISFERLEPFGSHLSIVADVVQMTSRANEANQLDLVQIVKASAMAFVSSAKNKTMLQGFSDFVDLLQSVGNDDPRSEKTVSKVLESIATTMVPYSSLVNEFRRENDNVVRETKGLVEAVKNKIPGLSKELPARRFWLTGEVQTYSSNPLLNIFPTSQMSDDPLIKGLMRYNVPLTAPSDTIKGVELTTEQYEDYLTLHGTVRLPKYGNKTLYEALLETYNGYDKTALEKERKYLLAHDEYARKSPLSREMDKVKKSYQDAAQSAMVQMSPELFPQVKQKLSEGDNVYMGISYMNEPLFSEEGYQYVDDPEVQQRLGASQEKTNNTLETLIDGPGPGEVQ